MRRNLLISLIAVPALVIALWARPAAACGAYGPPTDEQKVSRAAWSALHDNFVDRGAHVARVEVDRARGMARVDATVQRAGKAVSVVLVYALVDGTWTLAGRIDRPATQAPSSSVAASPSTVRKTL